MRIEFVGNEMVIACNNREGMIIRDLCMYHIGLREKVMLYNDMVFVRGEPSTYVSILEHLGREYKIMLEEKDADKANG